MSDHQLYVLFLALGVIAATAAIAFISIKFYKKIKANKVRKKLKRGVDKEKEAAVWLKRNGYKILDYQCSLSYTIREDRTEKRITVSPDFKVVKNGQEQYIEVKSGQVAPRIENKDTRRQLLEYHFIEPSVPILLLNMETKELKRIHFSQVEKQHRFWRGLGLGIILGLLLAFALYCWFVFA